MIRFQDHAGFFGIDAVFDLMFSILSAMFLFIGDLIGIIDSFIS